MARHCWLRSCSCACSVVSACVTRSFSALTCASCSCRSLALLSKSCTCATAPSPAATSCCARWKRISQRCQPSAKTRTDACSCSHCSASASSDCDDVCLFTVSVRRACSVCAWIDACSQDARVCSTFGAMASNVASSAFAASSAGCWALRSDSAFARAFWDTVLSDWSAANCASALARAAFALSTANSVSPTTCSRRRCSVHHGRASCTRSTRASCL